MKRLKAKLSTEDFDRKFEKNEDVMEHLDVSKARVNRHVHRINIDFPELFIKQIDDEANKIGVARTALIKIWIAERLQATKYSVAEETADYNAIYKRKTGRLY